MTRLYVKAVADIADRLLGIYATTGHATGVELYERLPGFWLLRRIDVNGAKFVIPDIGFTLEHAVDIAQRMIGDMV
jgi:hypothetical protein